MAYRGVWLVLVIHDEAFSSLLFLSAADRWLVGLVGCLGSFLLPHSRIAG